jgi:hypothetical protein
LAYYGMPCSTNTEAKPSPKDQKAYSTLSNVFKMSINIIKDQSDAKLEYEKLPRSHDNCKDVDQYSHPVALSLSMA